MESTLDGIPRTYIIKRSQHYGYGFVAGSEFPTMIKVIEPNGPSNKRLLPGDVIMAVNGIDVENATRDQIIKMIQLCNDQIEIKVRQASYEEMIRAKNLADPKFYTFNKSNNNFQRFQAGNRPQPLSPPNQSPLNRLVTSISQQQEQLTSNSPFSPFTNGNTPPVQIKPFNTVLKQKSSNGIDRDENNNGRMTIGRSRPNYGRHSPVPQRCKSSVDGPQNSHLNKKPGDPENDQPLLKRSNTMRPSKPSNKVMEIFKVVIKIFFETGHTRVLTYNQDTTVGVILETLSARSTANTPYSEQIKRYFGLALTLDINVKGSPKEQAPKSKLLHILDENDSIMKIRQLPYATSIRLLYRMVYPPSDVSSLYIQDKVAFEYLYQQSCNDLEHERFVPELDQETALKLCALRLLEYVHTNYSKAHGNSKDPKVYIKLIKDSPGIKSFLPLSMANSLDKKGKKKISARMAEHLKKNFVEFDFEPPKVKSTTNLNRYTSTSFHELSLPEMQSSPSEYIKLLFLHYLSQLPCYGNYKWPVRAPTGTVERTSGGDCSSSLESVPRTSDSSPLIKQDRNLNSHSINNRLDNSSNNNISRLAQMNSMRSLSSVQSSSNSQPTDQADMVQTPSIESISSITFNMQNSPSPQQTPIYSQQQIESYNTPMTGSRMHPSPSPMFSQQDYIPAKKHQDNNSIDRHYGQRYQPLKERPIEELLKTVILLPPPPPSPPMFDDTQMRRGGGLKPPTSHLTQILTDRDLERLRVPPPPRILN